jgi:integrase
MSTAPEGMSYERHARFIMQQRLAALPPERTNAEVVAEWWDIRTNPKRTMSPLKPSTQVTYRRYMRYFLDWLTERDLHIYFVTADDVMAYASHLHARGVSRPIVESYLNAPASLYEWLLDIKHLVISNPVGAALEHHGIRQPESRPPPRALGTVAENQAMLGAANNLREFMSWMVLAKCGPRCEEYLSILDTDLDFQAKRVHLTPHPPKRHVDACFMDDELEAVLRQWLDIKRALFPRNPYLHACVNAPVKADKGKFEKSIKAMARRAGLIPPSMSLKRKNCDNATIRATNVTPHTGRRTMTTLLRNAGCPTEYVAECRGDKRQTRVDAATGQIREVTQEKYLPLPWQQVRAAYLAVMPRFDALRILDDARERVRIIDRTSGMGPMGNAGIVLRKRDRVGF